MSTEDRSPAQDLPLPDDVVWPSMSIKDLAFATFDQKPHLFAGIDALPKDGGMILTASRQVEVPTEYAQRLLAAYRKEKSL